MRVVKTKWLLIEVIRMSSPFVYDTDDCDKHQQNDWNEIFLMKGMPHSSSAQSF